MDNRAPFEAFSFVASCETNWKGDGRKTGGREIHRRNVHKIGFSPHQHEALLSALATTSSECCSVPPSSKHSALVFESFRSQEPLSLFANFFFFSSSNRWRHGWDCEEEKLLANTTFIYFRFSAQRWLEPQRFCLRGGIYIRWITLRGCEKNSNWISFSQYEGDDDGTQVGPFFSRSQAKIGKIAIIIKALFSSWALFDEFRFFQVFAVTDNRQRHFSHSPVRCKHPHTSERTFIVFDMLHHHCAIRTLSLRPPDANREAIRFWFSFYDDDEAVCETWICACHACNTNAIKLQALSIKNLVT